MSDGVHTPGLNGEAIEAELTDAFAARLKAQVSAMRVETEEFPLLVASKPGDLTITVVAKKVVEDKAVLRSGRHSNGAFIVEVTDHVKVDDGENELVLDWIGVHKLLGLPASFTIDQTPKCCVGGSGTIVGSVAEDIMEWMTTKADRAAARMGS